MKARRTLVPVLLAMLLAGTTALPVRAQNEMSFTTDEVESGESLFDRVDAAQEEGAGGAGVSFDETSVTEHDALACAAGLGCEGLAVSQDDALVLTGHNTAETAREAYQKQYGDPGSDAGEEASGKDLSADADKGDMSFTEEDVDEGRGDMSFSGDEAGAGESLFDRVDAAQEEGAGGAGVSFDETSVTEHDALACAAGLGCEGLAVSQDDALVLTGHNTAETAREAYQKQYGDPGSDAGEEASGKDLSADAEKGDMSFSEEEVQDGNGSASPENRFTEAEIAAFSAEEDALWSCAAGFGCKGAADGLTPHEALHRLGLPDYSYQWPLAACATNAPGACAEIGISLMDAMRIMSHLANPNR